MAIPREYENVPNPAPEETPVTGPSVDKEELTDDNGELETLVEEQAQETSGLATG